MAGWCEDSGQGSKAAVGASEGREDFGGFIPGVSTHARERIAARYGFNPTHAEWLDVVEKILDRKALMVSAPPDGGMILSVKIRDQDVLMVWATSMALITTVLPRDHKIKRAPLSERARERRDRL